MLFKKTMVAAGVSAVVLGLSACGSSDSGSNGTSAATVPHEIQSEAAPATETDVFFGGNTDTDSSGSITYLVVAESGVAFQPDAELQGLTLEGVGSGTTISHVQILGSEDDGIEWFGGAVDVDHIVINGQDDDGLDFDDGYRGNVSYAIVRMNDTDGDTGIEADTRGSAEDPVNGIESSPNLSYVTVLGNIGKSKSTKGANFKQGFAGKMYRSVFIDDSVNTVAAGGFDGNCIDIDDTLDANLAMIDTVCATAMPTFTGDSAGLEAFKISANNDMSDTTTSTINVTTLAVTSDVALDATMPAGIDDNAWVGAVDPTTASPWWDGWTVHLANDTGSLKNVNFNPLAAEIADGTITPATVHACPAGTSKGAETFVSIEGASFPVCLLQHMVGDVTYSLTNDHVYMLSNYIKVGNGGVQDALPANVDASILNIQAGTQIFAQTGAQAGIRVTRGAEINVNGTAAMPVIMSAATFDLGSGTITGGTDYTGRGDWGGLVVNGYAKTNSLDN